MDPARRGAGADGGPVNAPSGAVDADGVRCAEAPHCGEQYFACDVAIAKREAERD